MMIFDKLKLKTKVLLGVCAPLMLIIVFGAIIMWSIA